MDAPIDMIGSMAVLDASAGMYVLSLALCDDMHDCVDALGLTAADFSRADPTVDMIYLIQTQKEVIAESHRLSQRLQSEKEKAERLARTDPLTGLANRRELAEWIDRESIAERRLAVFHLDLDHFKRINDTLGHAAGDAVVLAVAGILKDEAGETGIAARIGGDEFILVVESGAEDVEGARDARQRAERIVARVATPIVVPGGSARTSVSIGVTQSADRAAAISLDALLMETDFALYRAKEAGRNRVHVFDGKMRDSHLRMQALARDLGPAIESGQFKPVFQPQVDAWTGRILGAEVLARWDHPRFGRILPGEFLFLTGRGKLTERMDEVVQDRALRAYRTWARDGIAPDYLSFNVTASRLAVPGFVDGMRAELDRHGVPPHAVCFEIVEAVLLDETAEEIVAAANDLVRAGFRVVLDDFGTGRASMSALINVPFSMVKIDRSFVRGCPDAPKKRRLTKSIIDLAHSLDIDVLAEGVETRAERDALMAMGCVKAQGYLFSRPLDAGAFEAQLRASAPAAGSWRDMARTSSCA